MNNNWTLERFATLFSKLIILHSIYSIFFFAKSSIVPCLFYMKCRQETCVQPPRKLKNSLRRRSLSKNPMPRIAMYHIYIYIYFDEKMRQLNKTLEALKFPKKKLYSKTALYESVLFAEWKSLIRLVLKSENHVAQLIISEKTWYYLF